MSLADDGGGFGNRFGGVLRGTASVVDGLLSGADVFAGLPSAGLTAGAARESG